MDRKTGFNIDNTYIRLPKKFYSDVEFSDYPDPKLAILNEKLCRELGLDIDFLKSEEGVDILCAKAPIENSKAVSQAYSGHQFGYFTMLGDGRAVLLGEHISPDGERYDIHLKGSGRTVYSRRGDGRAVLGPMLREYLVSEAMYALGIPTTRSLSVAFTGQKVYREGFRPGAVLARVAKSHIRAGTFQFAANFGDENDIRVLADYSIKRHYDEISDLPDDRKYISFLEKVIERQASLIAKWQLAGFVHGVMNTDNMLISGETIDYGPCAFMDTYDPETVFSSIDTYSRYAYGKQPEMAAWNLARFAEAILPLISEDEKEAVSLAQAELEKFPVKYRKYWYEGMKKKLGMTGESKDDDIIVNGIIGLMQKYKADYTNTFVSLTTGNYEDNDMFSGEEFSYWKEIWEERLSKQSGGTEVAHGIMKNNNPYIIPRNYLVEEALERAERDNNFDKFNRLLEALEKPFSYDEKYMDYAKTPDRYQQKCTTYCGT